MKISFGFGKGGGSSGLMFIEALLSVEIITACLKTRQYIFVPEWSWEGEGYWRH